MCTKIEVHGAALLSSKSSGVHRLFTKLSVYTSHVVKVGARAATHNSKEREKPTRLKQGNSKARTFM